MSDDRKALFWTWKPLKFTKEIQLRMSLTCDQEFMVVRRWAKRYPDAVKALLKHPESDCPFPKDCNRFPCETMSCNADTCENGYEYRMS